MDLLKVAADIFIQKLGSDGGNLNVSSVISGLKGLLPTSGGEIDIPSLLKMFQGDGGLASLASSWLGDSGNQKLDPSQLMGLLGASKVEGFAKGLGIDSGTASSGLASMIPDLIDKNSVGGSLMKGVAGSLGKGLLGKLF